MKSTITVVCRESQKGNIYNALSIDLGYAKRFICFDMSLIAEVTGISFEKLATMKPGDEIPVFHVESIKV